MNYLYEFVQYDKNIPGKILMQDKPGWRCNTMPHWHAELEFVYILSGSLKVIRNGKMQSIHSGEFYFCNSKTIHSTVTPDNTSNYKYIVLLLSHDLLLRFQEDCSFDIPSGSAYEHLKAQLECLVKLLEPPKENTRLNLDIEKNKVLLEICQILLSECLIKPISNSDSILAANSYAKTIMEYVRQNYNQPLSLPTIANMVGLSPQYLSKYFRKATGFGIMHYINRVRLDYANEDLLDYNITVVDAALNNGFPNVKSYVKLCKDIYGMSPSELRKTLRNAK